MKPGDKITAVLGAAMREIQELEFKFRKDDRTREADGLYAAWRILSDMHNNYIEQKFRNNPFWRWCIQARFYRARKAIRKVEL